MNCPCCGAAELVHDTRDLRYTYKGETTTIPTVTGDHCPACSECIRNREQGDRYSELVGDARITVMARLQRDPAFVSALDQEADRLARKGEPELAAHLLEPLTALRAAIQAGTNSGPGLDAEQVFARFEDKYGL